MVGKGCINVQASLYRGGRPIGKDQAMWLPGRNCVQAKVTSAKALRLESIQDMFQKQQRHHC